MSDKEIELIKYLNNKLDCFNRNNNEIKKAVRINKDTLNVEYHMSYCNGYNIAIRDFKLCLLKLLKGDEVIIDDNV